MAKIVVDTSILLSVFEKKTDYLTLLEENYSKNLIITSTIKAELEKHKLGKLALELITKRNIPTIEYKGKFTADNAILDFCKTNNCILATHDKELAKRAKHKALKTIRIRQNTYLID